MFENFDPTNFQPDPVLLAFLPVKQIVYLPVILLLALVRALVARGAARQAALLALVVALAGLSARYLPEVLDLRNGTIVRSAGFWRSWWGGAGMNVAASIPLLASAVLPGRRWWGIDVLHVLALAGFLGLWGYTIWA
ncbi:hypothetical protein [Pelagovum pacificum]|uniref:Uncharacterized protein n=1 Tax=Pelagovum pacificum TaxID=2588711 RepID=A0A5C5GDB6_9RHOB|nr:hypothetical protein [Pelagovum pacificum]QQA44080.1 hypothetical protein I8N54_05750 [Pelagovum pacificum]TNY32792.1 hypothetical protein FHY64_05810 [Pelagovum pacificum]